MTVLQRNRLRIAEFWAEGVTPMSNDNSETSHESQAVARLIRETGITEQEARELIELIGLNWASLVREARLLKK